MTVTQQLMGHEDVSTTQRYIAVPPESARQAIELRARQRKTTEQGLNYKGASLFPVIADSTSNDPWIVLVRAMLDPANLNQALRSENVEDVLLNEVPLIEAPRR